MFVQGTLSNKYLYNKIACDSPLENDISIAKNYLEESELRVLNNLVSGYFDLAEINAIEHKPMYMSDHVQ